MKLRKTLIAAGLSLAAGLGWAAPASAHCDTLDGPVVSAARAALDKGDANLVLVWVQKGDEPAIRSAFEQARKVRAAGGEAKALADQYFFETLVRIHRAGEGAPFEGLKPAGTVEPPVAAADQAIARGELKPLAGEILARVEKGLHGQFERVVATSNYDPRDLEAGREHVKAYVEYVHYAERLYDAAGPDGEAGHAEPTAAHAH